MDIQKCGKRQFCVSQSSISTNDHLGDVTPCGKEVGTITEEPVTAIRKAEHKDSRFLWNTVGTKSHGITAQKSVMLKELNIMHDFDISTVVTNYQLLTLFGINYMVY